MVFAHFFLALIWFKAAPALFTRFELSLVAALLLAAISAGSGLAAQMTSIKRVSTWAQQQINTTGRIVGIPMGPLALPYGICFAVSLLLAWLTLMGFDQRFWRNITYWAETPIFAAIAFSLPLALHWVISSVLMGRAARG